MKFVLVLSALLASTALSTRAAAPMAVVSKTPVADGGWDYLNFDPIHRRLYVSRSDGTMVVDVDTGQITNKLVDAKITHAAVPAAGGDVLVVTSTALGSAIVADAKTGAVRATIATGKRPDGAFLEAGSGLVWVLDNSGAGIALIDPKSATKVATIAVPGALESAAQDGKGRVYVNVEDKNEIAVVNVKSRKVVAHYQLAGCDEPSGLAYGEGRLVATCANRVAAVVEAKTGKLVANLPIGPRPDTAFYDAARKVVFVPTGGDGKLTVISPSTARIISVVDTQLGARTQGFDPKTGALYLMAANYNPPATAGGRPQMIPGTAVLLKLNDK